MRFACLGVLAASLLLSRSARTEDLPFLAATGAGSRVVSSVFFVAKSENRNQVHYGLTLDASCRPSGSAPVFAYWQMRERGPRATEPLLAREVPAYGVAWQRVTDRGDHGGRVVLGLNAVPGRTIAIDSTPDGEGCAATASVVIDGAPAILDDVFAQLRWPFGIDYLLLVGHSPTDGRPLRERLSP